MTGQQNGKIEEKLIKSWARGRDGEDELRLLRCRGTSYGKEWVNTKLEIRKDGEFKGAATIRDSEIAEVASMLSRIADRIFGGGGAQRQQNQSQRGQQQSPREQRPQQQRRRHEYGPDADDDESIDDLPF